MIKSLKCDTGAPVSNARGVNAFDWAIVTLERMMGLFVGVFLSGSEWCFTQLDATAEGTRLLEHHEFSLPENLSTVSILKSLETVAELRRAITNQVTRTAGELCKDVAQEISRFGLHKYFKEYVTETIEQVGTVAIAHPYGLSPTVRRGLPALVGRKAIDLQRANVNDHLPRLQAKDGIDRVCAVEVPFAACIELLASGRISSGTRVIVLSDCSDGIEWTDVAVSRSAGSVTMHAEAYSSGLSDHVPGRLKSLLDSTKTSPHSTPVIVYVERLEICRPLRDILADCAIPIKPTEIAAGAARYAALCDDAIGARVLGIDGVFDVEFTSIAPHAIGVCGQIPEIGTVWCPLIDAGKRLGTDNGRLYFDVDENLPPRLTLAESTDPNRSPGEWVVGVDNLRLYAEVSIDAPRKEPCGLVEISIQSSTSHRGYGWSDPFITCSPAPLTNSL